MTIYTLITFDTEGNIQDMEHFDTRPQFIPDAPRWSLYIGEMNGGDTRRIDSSAEIDA